jgi:hypothetical protein
MLGDVIAVGMVVVGGLMVVGAMVIRAYRAPKPLPTDPRLLEGEDLLDVPSQGRLPLSSGDLFDPEPAAVLFPDPSLPDPILIVAPVPVIPGAAGSIVSGLSALEMGRHTDDPT